MSDFRIELTSKAFGKSDDPEALLDRCRALCRERDVISDGAGTESIIWASSATDGIVAWSEGL